MQNMFTLIALRLGILSLFLVAFPLFAQDQWKNIYTEQAWKDRDAWQKPAEILKLLNLKKGSYVADLGCHEGYMTFKLSLVVGSTGKVFAVDIDDAKLEKLKSHVARTDPGNIEVVKAKPDDPLLPLKALDAVIIMDTYHEMVEHDKILSHILESLKPGGMLLLCEPVAEARRELTRAEQQRKHELGMSFALNDLRASGFVILFSKDPFIDREKIKGDKMWIIVAQKK